MLLLLEAIVQGLPAIKRSPCELSSPTTSTRRTHCHDLSWELTVFRKLFRDCGYLLSLLLCESALVIGDRDLFGLWSWTWFESPPARMSDCVSLTAFVA